MTISNQSEVQFDFTLPDGTTETETRASNIVTTEILTYSFTKVKSSNKTFLQEGETATQTVVLTNNSLLNLSNLFFSDTMTTGATFVAGSVRIDGVAQPTYNPATGFPLADLAVGASTIVEFDVTVN